MPSARSREGIDDCARDHGRAYNGVLRAPSTRMRTVRCAADVVVCGVFAASSESQTKTAEITTCPVRRADVLIQCR
jgi:hypothetical protein